MPSLFSRDIGHTVRAWLTPAGDQVPLTRPILDNVREYALAGRLRVGYGATSVVVELPPLGETREIYLISTTRCYFSTGPAGLIATAATAHDLPADDRWHLRVPDGHTHLAVIRDAADGTLSVVPVA